MLIEIALHKTEFRKQNNCNIIILLPEQACNIVSTVGTMYRVPNSLIVKLNTFLVTVIWLFNDDLLCFRA